MGQKFCKFVCNKKGKVTPEKILQRLVQFDVSSFMIYSKNPPIRTYSINLGIVRDENSLLGSFSVLFFLSEPIEFPPISTYFHVIPPKHVDLFTASVKSQATLTRKIVGSYSWIFTVH